MCLSEPHAAESSMRSSKEGHTAEQKWWKSTITQSFISVSSEVNLTLYLLFVSVTLFLLSAFMAEALTL